MIGTATPKVTWVGRARTLTFFLLALLVAALLDVFLVAPKPAQAATITVGTAADDTTVNANCTLREAITAANTNAAVDACASGAAGADTISFNIPTTDPGFNSTTGVFTISPTSGGMPQITEPLTIDGYSQPDASAATSSSAALLKIELSGAGPPAGATGLKITAANTTVKGLVINRWAEGVRISDSGVPGDVTGNQVTGNYIGTDWSGSARQTNTFGVVIENSPENTIGGATPGARNVISGNDSRGITIFDPGARGNKVLGNYIGTRKDGGLHNLGNVQSGVVIENAPENTIGGTEAGASNIISDNGGSGVEIVGVDARGNQVIGNFMTANGRIGGGLGRGVGIENAPNNTIGGTTAGARNIISFSGTFLDRAAGVRILGAGATGNRVMGNYIGTDFTGTLDHGNGMGVYIVDAAGNTIGGTEAGARNVISGNIIGVHILDSPDATGDARGNKVLGNYIGTDFTGTKDLGNTLGVVISGAPENTIGGTTAGARNIISASGTFSQPGPGVRIVDAGATDNQVMGNYIGTDASGTLELGNSQSGVSVLDGASSNIIGGTTTGARNLISANQGDGVLISNSNGNQVQGNYIGTDKNGTRPTDAPSLGNSGSGVGIDSQGTNNTIGGTASGARNLISDNQGDGVLISGTGSTGNRILSNSIFFNTGGLGIDLDPNGPTANDDMDPDVGPNNLQNKPQITSAKPIKVKTRRFTTIKGTLNSTPGATFTIQLFRNLSGEDEGRTLLAHLPSITTNTTGAATFTKRVSRSAAPVGSAITATATNNSTGDTSEISTACAVSGVACSR